MSIAQCYLSDVSSLGINRGTDPCVTYAGDPVIFPLVSDYSTFIRTIGAFPARRLTLL